MCPPHVARRRGADTPVGPYIVMAVAVACACLLAQQPERARTEALARRATERLQALQREADLLASEEQTLIGDLRKLEIDRQLKAEQVKQIDAEEASVQAELETTSQRMDKLQASEEAERAHPEPARRRDVPRGVPQ